MYIFHCVCFEFTPILYSFREIDAIDSEFTKCTHFLVTLLNKIIKRGSFPYRKDLQFLVIMHGNINLFTVETLAFSIASLEVGL